MISYGFDLLRSGWSFFFRFPDVHTEHFIPAGIFLGPVFQACVFALAWILFTVFHGLLGGTALEAGQQGNFFTSSFLAFIVLALWTGFFHEDGLADTADGLGVPSYGAQADRRVRIREAMKDSRLGTYGVSSLAILWICRYAFSPFVSGGGDSVLPGLLFVVFSSRLAGLSAACCFIAPRSKGADDEPGIARHLLSEISYAQRWVWLLLLYAGSVALWIAMISSRSKSFFLLGLLLSFTVACLWLWFLRRRHGAICGDSIGSSICLTEIILVLSFQYL